MKTINYGMLWKRYGIASYNGMMITVQVHINESKKLRDTVSTWLNAVEFIALV